jgi:hypothetical protein
MNTEAVMCMAFTRVNALFIIYHSHTTDGRGHRGHRPRPEQAQLNQLLRLKMNPAAALLADIVMAKPADSKAR